MLVPQSIPEPLGGEEIAELVSVRGLLILPSAGGRASSSKRGVAFIAVVLQQPRRLPISFRDR